MWLEVMKEKERMRKTEFTIEFGITLVCAIIGVKHIKEFVENTYLTSQGPKLFFGDLWFGSVKAAHQVRKLGHHTCFAVKTAHLRTPKKFLEETMTDFSGGTWILLKGNAKTKIFRLFV